MMLTENSLFSLKKDGTPWYYLLKLVRPVSVVPNRRDNRKVEEKAARGDNDQVRGE